MIDKASLRISRSGFKPALSVFDNKGTAFRRVRRLRGRGHNNVVAGRQTHPIRLARKIDMSRQQPRVRAFLRDDRAHFRRTFKTIAEELVTDNAGHRRTTVR
jgi:hypothetical protein